MSKPTVVVTGASGQLGQRVLELLLERADAPQVIATTRTPAKLEALARRGVDVRAADFDDESTLVPAFSGAKRALLISTDALDAPGHRQAQHARAIRALARAGVEHVVYTSLPSPDQSKVLLAPDHAATEREIVASGLDYTFLRNNVYADLLLGSLPAALATGQLVDARGNGKVAYVTRDDCARVAAAVVADFSQTGKHAFDVTGPDAVSSEDLARIASEVAGRPVRHISVPLAAVIQGMVQHGLPEHVAGVYASFDTAIANHELSTVTNTVERFTGRKPQSLREYLSAQRARLAA